jgi:hypothetical protein
MTEHKFGTWYPIEEMQESYTNTLIFDCGDISKGYKHLGHIYFLYDDSDCENDIGWATARDPQMFMRIPLPPRPGEKK